MQTHTQETDRNPNPASAPGACYPPIEECVRVIAAKAGAPVHAVAAALLAQAQEMNMDAEELVHTQYRTATGQSGFEPDTLKADNTKLSSERAAEPQQQTEADARRLLK